MRGNRAALLAGVWLSALACGRTGLRTDATVSGGSAAGGEGGSVTEPPVHECLSDADCSSDDACAPAVCSPPDAEHEARYCATHVVVCDDGDACTNDRCNPDDGRCVHEGGNDSDHDGFRGPAAVGTPASCGGPDCDDTDPRVFPGATEICDGKDNDCNGAIDEGARYSMLSTPVLIAPNSFQSEAGGFAFDGSSYGVTYTDTAMSGHTRSYFELLNADGAITAGPSLVSEINADTRAGSLATSGRSFFTAWSDARQAANYEIYGTRFDQKAEKLEAGQRLTDAPGFSLQPSTTFTGAGYRVVWEDQRWVDSGGVSAIYARKVTLAGQADGGEVRLTGDQEDADFPDSDVSETRLGVTYTASGPPRPDGNDTTSVRFRSFDLDLSDDTGSVEVGTDGQEPAIVRTDETFVMVWHTGDAVSNWGPSLQGAVVDARGALLAAGPVTMGDTHAKRRSLVSLGDRVLLVWSATPDDSSPFQLYYEVISARDLSVLTPRQPLVTGTDNLIDPSARLGPQGDVGVIYSDSEAFRSYFVHLSCTIAVHTR